MVGQSDIEKAMLHYLGIDVRYGTEAASINETAEQVEVKIGRETITSKYLIAADGAHLMSRKHLNICRRSAKYVLGCSGHIS